MIRKLQVSRELTFQNQNRTNANSSQGLTQPKHTHTQSLCLFGVRVSCSPSDIKLTMSWSWPTLLSSGVHTPDPGNTTGTTTLRSTADTPNRLSCGPFFRRNSVTVVLSPILKPKKNEPGPMVKLSIPEAEAREFWVYCEPGLLAIASYVSAWAPQGDPVSTNTKEKQKQKQKSWNCFIIGMNIPLSQKH